jgi:acetyltransferase-like isoleucine patch superfamily enzyme
MQCAIFKNLRHRFKLFRNRLSLMSRYDVLIEPGVTIKYPDSMEFGARTTIQSCTYLYGSRNGAKFQVGDHTVISMGCAILGEGGVTIGKHVHLGPGVVVTTQRGDSQSDQNSAETELKYDPVNVGDGTWIGTGSVIMPGAHIGDCTIVAPMSVVYGRTPDSAKLAGNPARPQKRF